MYMNIKSPCCVIFFKNHIVQPKYMQFFVNHTSIKLEKYKKAIKKNTHRDGSYKIYTYK